MTSVDVTVLVVTYRSAAWVAAAIESARHAAAGAGLALEVVVVDNASDDDSTERALATDPSALVLRNVQNVGFGAATNQASAAARGEAWLLLNPDARIDAAALGPLVTFLREHPRAALVAPSIAGPGGAESAGMLPSIRSALGHFLFINRVAPPSFGPAWRGFQLRRATGLNPQRVEWASAAAVLARPEAIRAVGGFDASIFMYGEDVDLAARLADAGWEVWLVPEARAWHAIAASSDGPSTAWLDGIDGYLARRGAGRIRRGVVCLVVAAGLAVRAVAAARRAGDPEGRMHAARMRAGASRALALAARAWLRSGGAAGR